MPEDFCDRIPKFQNLHRAHAAGSGSPMEILNDEKFSNLLKSELSGDQYQYVINLLTRTSESVKDLSDLRSRLSKKQSIFDENENQYDRAILLRIFNIKLP